MCIDALSLHHKSNCVHSIIWMNEDTFYLRSLGLCDLLNSPVLDCKPQLGRVFWESIALQQPLGVKPPVLVERKRKSAQEADLAVTPSFVINPTEHF